MTARSDGPRPRRVHIIGGGGSGKTTLARRLGAATGRPVVELDIGADLRALASSPEWISEGIYLYDVEPVLARADVIVWMDLPSRGAMRRIVTRHIRLSVLRKNRHPGFRRMLTFAWGQREYYTGPPRKPLGPTDWDALTRAATVDLLEPWQSKVVHLRSPRAARRWLATVKP
jgi:hypothetical protein